MADTSISEIMYTMMSLVFLLLGIVILVSILMSTVNPYEQVAFANVEKLRAAMGQACIRNQPVSIKFDLPQNTPKFTSFMSVMPIWMMRAGGDPNYVIYYEAFPAGDATGWEVYHSMQNRLVAPLPPDFSGGEQGVGRHVDSIRGAWKTRVVDDASVSLLSKSLQGVVISNILLGGKFDYFAGETAPGAAKPDYGPDIDVSGGEQGVGKWVSTENGGAPAEGDDRFAFYNYRGLTPFQKTSIKYAPCGENSLCLKTRSAVYKYQLRNCGDIQYIELTYDARNRKAIWGSAGIFLVAVVGGCILGTGGLCVAPIAASGEIIGGTGALTSAVTIIGPSGAVVSTVVGKTTEVVAGTLVARTASGLLIPVAVEVSGGTATALTPPAAAAVLTPPAAAAASTVTAAGGGSLLSSAASSFGRAGWKVAAGGAKLLLKRIPLFGIKQALGVGVLGAAGVATYKVFEFIAGAFLSYKVEDFNIASPCSISQMTIKKVKCNQLDCNRFVSYPIYKYGGDGRLAAAGQHYACVEKIGTDIDTPANAAPEGYCLKVIVHEKAGGFCWTPDPFKNGFWEVDTQYAAEKLDFFPINLNTAYIDSADAVVLKYYPLLELESWKEFLGRRLSWGWPG